MLKCRLGSCTVLEVALYKYVPRSGVLRRQHIKKIFRFNTNYETLLDVSLKILTPLAKSEIIWWDRKVQPERM